MNPRFLSVGLLVAALALASMPAPAAAQSSASQNEAIAMRARGAQRIVVARAASVTPRWFKNAYGDELIVSDVVLEVEETIKGLAPAQMLVTIEGGTMGEVTLRVSDLPPVERGDRGVYFLDEVAPGAHVLHERGRGVLKLTRNNVVEGTSLRLSDVRRLVIGR
jgi:hypothetical protein